MRHVKSMFINKTLCAHDVCGRECDEIFIMKFNSKAKGACVQFQYLRAIKLK